jgi:hypothetical protein
MVFFFESSEGYVMYMGADKYENEDLIKYGLLGENKNHYHYHYRQLSL